MAKIARRSVASNPSSLTISNYSTTLPNSTIKIQPQSSAGAVLTSQPTILIELSPIHVPSAEPVASIIHKHNGSSTSSTVSNHTNNNVRITNSTAIPTKSNSNFVATSSTKAADNNSTTINIHKTDEPDLFNATAQIDLEAVERERMRIEFYATYDVMTGVRIAATLGGFFALMVFLIVYKSRSHSNETLKVLKDPKTAALAVACMQEEEDRKIMEAMDATGLSIFPDEYDTMLFRRQRMLSLGNVSAPPVLNRGFRFSSVGGGGYSSLLEPPRRSSFSYGGPGARRKSASESSRILSNYPMGSSFGTDDYFVETDDELDHDYNQLNEQDEGILQNQGFLEVPLTGQDTRRSSAMTCCSTESSYLERRCSALTLGLNHLPPSLRHKLENTNGGQQRSRNGSSTELWDYYYPDIQVIQATPKTSPCPSERSLYDKPKYTTTRTGSQDTTTTAGSGISSIAVDSGGSSTYNYRKNSTSCCYDPESLQDKRLKSICDSENGGSFYQHFATPIESGSKRVRSTTSKYEDNNELKLMVMKRKVSDASSCITNNTNINNNSLSYILNNNNSSFTEAQAAAIAVIDGAVVAHMQRGAGICGTGVGRAPLASCSSFKMSSIDYQDSDLRSMGEDDSIFVESYADTDDDLEQFSTDSDEISLDIDEDDKLPTASRTTQRKINDIEKKLAPPPLPKIGGSTSTTLTANQQISMKSEPIFTDTMTDIQSLGQMNKCRSRPSLERHRTLSVSSSDKVQLVPSSRSGRNKSSILETHFSCPTANSNKELLLKPNLSPSNTPILVLRRAQLQQQSSDPQSLPTTTDEATTTTLETCSTEVPVVIASSDQLMIATKNTIAGSVARKQLAQQPPKLPSASSSSVTIKKPSSFSYDNNNDSSVSSSSNSNNKLPKKKRFSSNSSKLKNYRSHFSDGGCDQLIEHRNNDGVGQHHFYGIDNLISSGSNNGTHSINQFIINDKSKNPKNKTNHSIKNSRITIPMSRSTMSATSKSPFVILELPVINLSNNPHGYDNVDDDDDNDISERDDRSRGTCSEGAIVRHNNQPFRDPSLPGTSRKWSKETLF